VLAPGATALALPATAPAVAAAAALAVLALVGLVAPVLPLVLALVLALVLPLVLALVLPLALLLVLLLALLVVATLVATLLPTPTLLVLVLLLTAAVALAVLLLPAAAALAVLPLLAAILGGPRLATTVLALAVLVLAVLALAVLVLAVRPPASPRRSSTSARCGAPAAFASTCVSTGVRAGLSAWSPTLRRVGAAPLWAALMASTSCAFFMVLAPAMPMPEAMDFRSAISIELSPPPRLRGAEASGAGVGSMVSVT